MIEDPTAPAAAPGESLDELWSSWVASPQDPAAKEALVEAITETVSAEVSEALEAAAADSTTDGTTAGSDTEDAAAQIMDEEMTYGADDILSEQLSALGAAENFNDGMMTSDGTRDYDWT